MVQDMKFREFLKKREKLLRNIISFYQNLIKSNKIVCKMFSGAEINMANNVFFRVLKIGFLAKIIWCF